ncbi:hypothetical protein MUK42_32587 [Musa troglodytarum]|uniref:Uncharacterized protein n=1 Tax=Musa troglodytarum TaxID=320322 RepID=A0A9E7I0F8_9LILI|nr:hypothetical protein MUK42_32587 [Musa troglodytarum]
MEPMDWTIKARSGSVLWTAQGWSSNRDISGRFAFLRGMQIFQIMEGPPDVVMDAWIVELEEAVEQPPHEVPVGLLPRFHAVRLHHLHHRLQEVVVGFLRVLDHGHAAAPGTAGAADVPARGPAIGTFSVAVAVAVRLMIVRRSGPLDDRIGEGDVRDGFRIVPGVEGQGSGASAAAEEPLRHDGR